MKQFFLISFLFTNAIIGSCLKLNAQFSTTWGSSFGQQNTISQPSTTDNTEPTNPTFGSTQPTSSGGVTTFDDPGFPGGGTGQPPIDNAVPIDGGLTILLAVGIGKGLKSYRLKKQKTANCT